MGRRCDIAQKGDTMVCAKIKPLIAAMTASCMTPQEIAKEAGVSVNIVYRMRRGYMVKMDRFGCVCKVLGLDPENIIDYDRLASDQTEERKS
ncbi:hypothetical protein DWY88_15990 [Mediterraneibacter gnavus]|jgi:DNA-binding Xre family transcriptional regulator|uniref:HTH cro/C1-type domain-containing protein n=2 Tax=Mediterraneibacter gnavus TaxID=33038 RepID=A0A414UYY8_MEDGN|nr:hypothetical protein DWY88_15990 [Mediterraneibacter gnavus]RHG73159.1 hypothetical protein DW248_06165 [Mediterraneibacter gnavus]RHG87340.1 hypothetical protein DW243_04335 [Mediterraneibacter gnavus]